MFLDDALSLWLRLRMGREGKKGKRQLESCGWLDTGGSSRQEHRRDVSGEGILIGWLYLHIPLSWGMQSKTDFLNVEMQSAYNGFSLVHNYKLIYGFL